MSRNNKTDVKKLALGAGLAAAAGYLVGILTAPKSGKQTRRDIKHAAEKGIAAAEKDAKQVQAEVESLVKEAKTKGGDLSGKAKDELDDLVAKAKTAKEKATTVVAAVKKGEADDKELQRALDDAKKAIKHVRKYLSK